MARNGSGSYSVPNTFTAGATITASGHNQNWADIAAEMSNSLAADGQTPLTGPLKGSNGSASAPAYTFATDTNTGSYRSAADEYSISAGGVQVAKFNEDGIDAVDGKIKEGGVNLWDPGDIKLTARSTAPTGWLLCDGASYLRTTYPDLFDAISTTFGAADSTHFNVPDLRGRSPFGKDDMGGSAAGRLVADVTGGITAENGKTLGGTGGVASNPIAKANLPAVKPTGVMPSTAIKTSASNLTGFGVPQGAGVNNVDVPGAGSFYPSAAFEALSVPQTNLVMDNLGSGTALNGLPPLIVLNYIIKI